MHVVLSIIVARKERGSFSIVRGVTFMGRSRECDVRIALSQVSRKHCQVIKEGEELRIEDLGSSNGTYVNGKRIEKAVLAPGDRIGIGPVTLLVSIDDLPGQPDSVPDPAAASTDFAEDFTVDDEAAAPTDEDSMVDFTADQPPA